MVSYYQALAKTSDKIRVEELGKTAEGRPFIAATISSAATLRNLDHYREIQAKLADPRRTTPQEAAKLIAEGKTVVLITCSIHATEVASTHSAVQFVYNLLTQDTPKFRAILDNVIILLVPSQNPGWRGYRDALVSQDAGHAVRRHVAAGAVSEVRRATTTIATGTFSRSPKRGSRRHCKMPGIRKSSTMCTSKAPTRRACSCRRG